MHAIPVADFEERGCARPKTSDELGLADFRFVGGVYREKKLGPAPMEEFGIRWIRRNMPPDRSKVFRDRGLRPVPLRTRRIVGCSTSSSPTLATRPPT